MVPFRRHALLVIVFLFVFGSCDRVAAPQQGDLSSLDLRFGAWKDSAEAAADSLVVDHPYTGSITVHDTLWVRVKATGDVEAIRSVEAKVAGEWRKLSLPVFFPVAWTDSGMQRVKVGVYTEGNAFYDSIDIHVTDRAPVVTLPDLGGGSLRIVPDSTTRLFVGVEDDGAIDSVRWDLDGDGTSDTATIPGDTLALRWSIARILAARNHPTLRILVRDDDGHEILDSIPLTLLVPPPSLSLAGTDTVSIGDTIALSASATGGAPLEPVTWQDGRRGDTWSILAPSTDTELVIRAVVLDSMGKSDTAEHRVVVLRDAPRVVDQDTIRVHAGRSVHLSAGAVQRFGSVVSWSWDLDGNGTFGAADTLAGRDTTFETTGLRRVGLRATDDDGQTGAGSIWILVTDSVPTLSISVPAATGPGDTVQLSASASDPEGDSLRVLWIVDGDTTIGAVRKVAFTAVGKHDVRAVASTFTPAGTFLAGLSRGDSILVVADPPKLDLGNDSTIAWGGTWKALGASASDSTGSIVSTEWDFDGNGTWDATLAGWAIASHRFLADTGRVVVRARVTDDDGNTTVDSLALRLDPAPWNVALSAPDSIGRGVDAMVRLSWMDSMPAGSTVRWTTNDGLDTTRTTSGDADSVLVRGMLVDSLVVTAVLTSPSGAVTTRSTVVRLETLGNGPRIQLSGPDTVSWNDSIPLSAQVVGDVGSHLPSWTGGTSGASALRFAPANDTTLTYSARIVDDLGRADSTTWTVVVVRDVPVAQAGPDTTLHAGRSIHLSGAATQDFGSIVSWGWDLDGDGVFTTSTISAGIDTTFETTGSRTVVLRVQDDDGNVDLDTLLVAVADAAPSLSTTIPSTTALGDSILLTATTSDPDGDSLVVRWIVDGDTSVGAVRKVAFTTLGGHFALATVASYTPAGTFLAGLSRGDSILVVADPPKLDLGNDSTIAWGGTWKALGASASDSTGSIVSTEWDFDGNGTWDATLAGWAIASHRFLADTGRVVVRARVTDDDGNTTVDSLALRLDPAPWNVALSAPDSIGRGVDAMVRLSWIDSMPAGSTVRWTTNDGLDTTRTASGDADSVLVRGTLVDSLVVTAVLTSPSGAVTTRSAVVKLEALPAAPQVTVYGPFTVSWNDPIEAAAEVTGSIGDNPVFWSDGSQGLSATITAPAKDTTLNIRAWVTDDYGRTDTGTLVVSVVRDVPTADAGTDTSVHAGRSVHLSGAATQTFGSIVSWGWDLDGDGVFSSSPSNAGIDTTWESVGTRSVVLRVQDDDGNVDLDTLLVTVSDAAPSLSISIPSTTALGDSAVLTATASDPDGDSLVVRWIVDGDTTVGTVRKIAFASTGSHLALATASSYTASGTPLAAVRDSGSISVTSSISVSITAPDSVFLDTATNGTLLSATVDAPGGLETIEWSVDGGTNWTTGSPSGSFLWSEPGLGAATVIVRVQDSWGATDADTAIVQVAEAPPVVELDDSIRVLANSPDAGIPMTATSRFRGITGVHWTWTDLDGDHQSDEYLDPLTPLSSPLYASFPPGRWMVKVRVVDDRGLETTDSIAVGSVGFRLSISAPDTVAARSNVHATASVIRWPLDSAIDLMFGLGDDIVQDTVLDSRMPSADPQSVMLQVRFAGSSDWASASRTVQGVDDPPIVQEYGTTTVVAGDKVDLSFTATRTYGAIASWLWDLSAATGTETQPKGVVTDENPKDGTLTGIVFEPGSRLVRYGVVTDGGDTTWATRWFDVIGPPVAVDDTLGRSTRNGLDIGCEAGSVCDVGQYLLVDNDSMGFGLEGTPVLFGGLDGATIDSNSDGRWLSLPAVKSAGDYTYRYIISNGYLLDTGFFNIRIYEQTPVAVLDTSAATLPEASIYTENNATWQPKYTWQYNFPLPDGVEFASFYTKYPKINGAAMRTGNVQDVTGGDSTVPSGSDLLAVDPYLGYYFQYGPADWMQGEEEVLEFVHDIDTRRNDGLGIPGHTASTEIVMPVRFRRYVNTSVVPTGRMKGFSATYDCSGAAKFTYQMTVAPLKNVHDGDVTRVTIFDASLANGNSGYGDKPISGTLTSLDGKLVYPVEIGRNKDGDFEALMPNNDGGTLDLVFDLVGFLDEKGNPLGQVIQKWLPDGFNQKATHRYNSTGGSFAINNGCLLQ